MTVLDTKALLELARAYDREDAAHRGEPDPWPAEGTPPTKEDITWAEERLACAQAAMEAFRRVSPSQGEAPAPDVVEAETVWIVGASVGEYSDRSDWTVGVWMREQDAQAFIRNIDALGRVAIRADAGRYDSADEALAYKKAEARCREIDPAWSSYGGDAPIYLCWKEKVRRSTALASLAPRGDGGAK